MASPEKIFFGCIVPDCRSIRRIRLRGLRCHRHEHAKQGGDKGALGPAISDEAAAPNGGRFNTFKNGLI
ncbi:hypothetical protein [Bradyrhizobium sp. MOS003]|jgi:hypothetical protein|uniref:LGFP repeat-containing protein n=1 Tax=Bradyrhizobium sp. MOS003 TaxID=2133946 RepID=UPI000D125F44|nr:hypothetical protein [Bradyrhizobium sp. MOS003]PSO17379.1 hypothetical protein C7G42_21725 [Bradyrhizobium sp. MOS003]